LPISGACWGGLACACAALLAVATRPSVAAEASAPEVVFSGGRIYTLDGTGTEAQALAARGGRILAVGTDQEILALAGPETRRIALNGGTVVPGLIDAHGHLASLGAVRMGREDLATTKSSGELLERIAARAKNARAGEWILGVRWDQANWGEKEFPTHERLSAITPNQPVFLWRVDGHAGLANRRALELAGITRQTRNPSGGEILRDARGEPTGLLVDSAIGLVASRITTAGASRREELLAAQQACLSVGLTGIHDAGIDPAEAAIYQKLCDEGRWRLRVYAMLTANYLNYAIEHRPVIGYGGGRFTLRAIKTSLDGALGSRGAWLLQPYNDRPGHEGLSTQSPANLLTICRAALAQGYQVCTHAIGDRANREALNCYERALAERPGTDVRFRIEHAQVVALEDLPRFAKLGVIASMQPTHATSDMRWAQDRIGPERLKGAYAWATLLRSGARLAAGSDFPVESEDPRLGLYAAVTRKDRDGRPEDGWRAEECLTREQALRAFTLGAAHAAFEEREKGTLEPGKLADFAVFDRDLLRVPPRELLDAKVLLTVIGDEVVHRRP
jgi:predicted amidohydrolase YtcJ